MSPRKVDFLIFDADNHMYETTDAFTKYLPKEYDGLVKYVEVNGRTKIAINNVISDYIPNPTFEVVAAPGAQEEYFKKGNPEGKSRREIMGKPIRSLPAFMEPEPRLKLMDELGLDRALMWPTLASLLEERMRGEPEAVHAVIHALNQWMHEHWTFNYQDRIFPTPVINMGILAEAQKELEWVLERGAKIVLIRPAPVYGYMGPRSFALPEFDPFWKMVEEARHPGRDARIGQRLPALLRRVGRQPARRDDAVQGRLGIHGHRRPPGTADHGHGGVTDRPRSLHAVPKLALRPRRERQQLGAPHPRVHGLPPTRATPRSSKRTRSRSSSATSTCTPSTRRTPSV